MEINHGGGAARGLVLLIGGAPGGKRRQPVRPEAALGLLATLPTEALLGSPIPAGVLQLADPADPQLLLAHLQTASRTPGPVLVALAGQLTADRRRKELHLALAHTGRDNTRYTALPWAWLGDQLRQRAVGTTTVLADLVADPEAWSVLQAHGPEALTTGLPLFGQVSPPGTTGDGYAPPYTRALADQLRRAPTGTRPADLHHLASHSGLPAGALLLTSALPSAPGSRPALPPAPDPFPAAPTPTGHFEALPAPALMSPPPGGPAQAAPLPPAAPVAGARATTPPALPTAAAPPATGQFPALAGPEAAIQAPAAPLPTPAAPPAALPPAPPAPTTDGAWPVAATPAPGGAAVVPPLVASAAEAGAGVLAPVPAPTASPGSAVVPPMMASAAPAPTTDGAWPVAATPAPGGAAVVPPTAEAVPVPAPTAPVPPIPAPAPPAPVAAPARAGERQEGAVPVAHGVVDPRPGIAAALHGGDLARGAYLIADWERQLLRHQGPRAPQLADVAEAQAQLALAGGDLGRATERLIEAARLRTQSLPPQAPELATAVDNAVAIWGRLPRETALQQSAALLTLCRALPAGGSRLRDVEARLAQLNERTGLLRRAR